MATNSNYNGGNGQRPAGSGRRPSGNGQRPVGQRPVGQRPVGQRPAGNGQRTTSGNGQKRVSAKQRAAKKRRKVIIFGVEIAAAGAEKLGMKPYYLYRQKNMSGNFENTGYARPGKYGLYNILIMEEKQTIVALGAGSITKRVFPDGRIERCDNVKDVGLYIEKIDDMIERKKELFAE